VVDQQEGISADAQTQQYGYIRCYRAVVRDCGVMAAYLYGILEDYVQLGVRNGRPVVPSHDHLAKLMDCHRNTIITLMKKLRETGWVVQRETLGGTNEYFLPARGIGKSCAGGAQKTGTPCTKSVHKQDVVSKTTSTSPPLLPPEGAEVASQAPRYTAAFDRFWKSYGKTNGPKKPAFLVWQRLNAADRSAAAEAVAAWLASELWTKENGRFKPYPQKYLNQRMWETQPVSLNGHHEVTEDDKAYWRARVAAARDGKVFDEKAWRDAAASAAEAG
jgi:hypothetical protein